MEYNYPNFNQFPPYEGNTLDSNFTEQNLFNPSVQYEQAYMYYRYLAQQMEYKIKCKEYDNLLKKDK